MKDAHMFSTCVSLSPCYVCMLIWVNREISNCRYSWNTWRVCLSRLQLFPRPASIRNIRVLLWRLISLSHGAQRLNACIFISHRCNFVSLPFVYNLASELLSSLFLSLFPSRHSCTSWRILFNVCVCKVNRAPLSPTDHTYQLDTLVVLVFFSPSLTSCSVILWTCRWTFPCTSNAPLLMLASAFFPLLADALD